MFAFLSQAVTGVFLAMYYEPDVSRAYESASRITNELFLGELVHGTIPRFTHHSIDDLLL